MSKKRMKSKYPTEYKILFENSVILNNNDLSESEEINQLRQAVNEVNDSEQHTYTSTSSVDSVSFKISPNY